MQQLVIGNIISAKYLLPLSLLKHLVFRQLLGRILLMMESSNGQSNTITSPPLKLGAICPQLRSVSVFLEQHQRRRRLTHAHLVEKRLPQSTEGGQFVSHSSLSVI